MNQSSHPCSESAIGLGLVKTPCRKVSEGVATGIGGFLDANSRYRHLRGTVTASGPCTRAGYDATEARYAPIAAMSGLTPMMFITRVRL